MPAPVPPTNPPAKHGKDGVICLSTSRAGTPVPVALITDWTYDATSDKVETTALGDGNKTYVKGLADCKGTATAQWDSTDDTMFDAADSPDGVQMEIWPHKDSPMCLKGPAWIDVSMKGGVSSAVTVDITWQANGSWSRTSAEITATGATAGTPGTFTPAGASAPNNLAGMTGITAAPATAWTTGQHVLLKDASKSYWNGTAWTAGQAT